MRYATEPKNRIYVKRYGVLSFAKNMGKIVSNKYGQKLLDSSEKSTTNAMKIASKRAIQKTAESTGDLIGNKIAGKITILSTDLQSKESAKELQNKKAEVDVEGATPKERYISPKDIQKIIDELRLV